MSNTETAGPNGDGSQTLARESKWGQGVAFVLSTLALGAAGYIGSLDLGSLPGWAVATATVAVAQAVGLLTAWATKNKPNFYGKR